MSIRNSILLIILFGSFLSNLEAQSDTIQNVITFNSDFRFRIGYNIEKHLNLILRGYVVQQLITQGSFKEAGNRIRLDLNIRF